MHAAEMANAKLASPFLVTHLSSQYSYTTHSTQAARIYCFCQPGQGCFKPPCSMVARPDRNWAD